MAKRRMMVCQEHGHVPAPCVACTTLAAMATRLVRRRSDRGYEGQVLEFDFEPEEAENYRVFHERYPNGMGPLGEQVSLDSSAQVEKISKEEYWFVARRKRKSEVF